MKVNPELPTRVVQRKDVHGQPGRGAGKGPVLARATPRESRPVTEKPVNQLVDEFTYGSFLSGGMVLPYHYHLPKNYQPGRKYPLMVVLPGHGMGWDGDNLGVQLAADIPATAWLQPQWTGTAEDVIVLAPQHQRVGGAAEADLLVKLLDQFVGQFAVDTRRVYATTVSYGSQLLWEAFAKRPDLFAGGLVTGGFPVNATQATAIAAAEVPVWITHGEHDHLLNVSGARNSTAVLRQAYAARGKTPEQTADLVRYTEYADAAFSSAGLPRGVRADLRGRQHPALAAGPVQALRPRTGRRLAAIRQRELLAPTGYRRASPASGSAAADAPPTSTDS